MFSTVSWSDFGVFLQRVRRRRGISQETLAALLACHRTYLWRLEHGRNYPSAILLRSLELTCQLTSEESSALVACKQLRMYHLDGPETARWDFAYTSLDTARALVEAMRAGDEALCLPFVAYREGL